ncbi:MAG: hypothetical protein QF886_08635 [Planctomycetota bacterium]|nr:hypothetical protein [Planctomycetota bacterium]
MKDNTDTALLDWLFAHGGPIIRWRLVSDFGVPVSKKEAIDLKKAVLATDEVRRWLNNLGGWAIHGSKDTDAENAMAKLVEYGLRAGIPEFDDKMLPYAERGGQAADCFLIAAGYAEHRDVAARFRKRLAALRGTALRGDYDLYLPPEDARGVPKAWRGKFIYRPEYGWDDKLPLPSCYDLYAMAHWEHGTGAERRKIKDVVAYVSDPAFQSTTGGYLWNQEKNTCYSAGRVCLACLNPERMVLSVELFARYAVAREATWFQKALSELTQCRTDRGTYLFPSDYLKEKRNSYYIYQGAHMGLGENRRKRDWIEIESTFRMLNIRRLMSSGSVPPERRTAT